MSRNRASELDEIRSPAGQAPDGAVGSQLGAATLVLHWLVAIAVAGMLVYGFWIQTLPSGAPRTPFVQIHKSIGVLVLFAAAARAAWRFREGFPPAIAAHPAWERRIARWLHVFLIAATILMPITGIGRSLAYARPVEIFGWPFIPKLFDVKQEPLYSAFATSHDILAFLLAAAITLHLGASLKHHFFDRDRTLLRILGRGVPHRDS